MMFAARELAILLSVCLFLTATGCTPAARWAQKAYERIGPGMTAQEVTDEIGEPAQIVKGDPGQPEIWLYQFEDAPGVAVTILLVILFVGLIVLLVFSKGGGGGGIHGGGGSGDLAEFRVHFGPDGSVKEVSPIFVTPRP